MDELLVLDGLRRIRVVVLLRGDQLKQEGSIQLLH